MAELIKMLLMGGRGGGDSWSKDHTRSSLYMSSTSDIQANPLTAAMNNKSAGDVAFCQITLYTCLSQVSVVGLLSVR